MVFVAWSGKILWDSVSNLCTYVLAGILHYNDAIMSGMAFQFTGVSIVCLAICSGVDKKTLKVSCHWPFWGESTSGFTSQRAGDAENVSIWWRHPWIEDNEAHYRGQNNCTIKSKQNIFLTENISKCVFLNENYCSLVEYPEFVSTRWVNYRHIMAYKLVCTIVIGCPSVHSGWKCYPNHNMTAIWGPNMDE